MATPRSRYIRVSDLVLDELWDNDTAATFLRLLAWLRQRWAREHLTAAEACEAVIGGADAMRITGCSRPHVALQRLASWPLDAGLSAASASLETIKGVSSVRLKWLKVAEFQGWDARESGDDKPSTRPLRRPVSRRHVVPAEEKRSEAPTQPEMPLPDPDRSPAARSTSGPDWLETVWARGIEAAALYRPSASTWEINDSRGKSLRALGREHPKHGEDVFARVVHGYRYARRAWAEIEDHFEPETLLRPSNRAKYLEAYGEATGKGLAPPFLTESRSNGRADTARVDPKRPAYPAQAWAKKLAEQRAATGGGDS